MVVRDETPADWPLIHAVHLGAFPGPGEAHLVDRLRADGDLILSLVAIDDDGKLTGHIALSRMRAPFRALGLAPVSVLPDRQGAGIGGLLIRAGLARAEAEGWQGVFVLGDTDYYGRFGFRVSTVAGFDCRYAGPHFMASALSNEALPASTGAVSYPVAFDSLD